MLILKSFVPFCPPGLKILMVCFDKQLSSGWHRIATVVSEMGGKLLGEWHTTYCISGQLCYANQFCLIGQVAYPCGDLWTLW